MKKIPTLFVRDFSAQPALVIPEVTPGCEWVLAGEGEATRKYDGTCVMLDQSGEWWARREVKRGKTPPPRYVPISTDDETGKTVGWEPVEQSAFAKWVREALNTPWGVAQMNANGRWTPSKPAESGTYELCGPKVNGNPERIQEGHLLIRHGYKAAVDREEMATLPTDFAGLAAWLHARPNWEGIVWHHPDGRMAKIKGKDFRRQGTA
ncbi:DUF5565 family protein [Streptomyces globisporus]|uniref:RNA ligase 1 family protein n=1 Tax=Streptomyces globisporus TaxID=1908 RepID=UPI0037F71FBC